MWTSSQPASAARRSSPSPRFSEAELANAWQQRRYAVDAPLVDSFGRCLRVVFPGRRWGGPGPDFRGALLALEDGRLVRGDIELHRRARDWVEHRHAADPAYAQVVLHVVLELDAPTLDASGQPIATLVLAPERGPPQTPPIASRCDNIPDASRARDSDVWRSNGDAAGWYRGWSRASSVDAPCVRDAPAVLAVVEDAGRERFRARAARFEADLTAVDADQVVWRGVAEALGYTRNTAPFGQLADAVPWAEAAQVVLERGPVGLAGLLLGSAGLLDQATLPEAHAWRALQRRRGLRPALQRASWDRRELRAANAPAQRCRGLAELAARWTLGPSTRARARMVTPKAPQAGVGPAEQTLELVRKASALRRPGVWRFVRASPWVGRGRAQVVVVNVLLPFAAAAGVVEAAQLFERLPGEPTNRVVRYMAELLGGPDLRFRGACQQQGLLHLFKVTCASRSCELCPARGGAAYPLELWA